MTPESEGQKAQGSSHQAPSRLEAQMRPPPGLLASHWPSTLQRMLWARGFQSSVFSAVESIRKRDCCLACMAQTHALVGLVIHSLELCPVSEPSLPEACCHTPGQPPGVLCFPTATAKAEALGKSPAAPTSPVPATCPQVPCGVLTVGPIFAVFQWPKKQESWKLGYHLGIGSR